MATVVIWIEDEEGPSEGEASIGIKVVSSQGIPGPAADDETLEETTMATSIGGALMMIATKLAAGKLSFADLFKMLEE